MIHIHTTVSMDTKRFLVPAGEGDSWCRCTILCVPVYSTAAFYIPNRNRNHPHTPCQDTKPSPPNAELALFVTLSLHFEPYPCDSRTKPTPNSLPQARPHLIQLSRLLGYSGGVWTLQEISLVNEKFLFSCQPYSSLKWHTVLFYSYKSHKSQGMLQGEKRRHL